MQKTRSVKSGFMLDRVSVVVNAGEGHKSILKAISCEIGSGEIISVIGPNGSGKTTLLRVLLGLQTFAAGEICFNGACLQSYPRKALSRHLAYVPQHLDALGIQHTISVSMFLRLSRYPYLTGLRRLQSCDRDAIQVAVEKTGIEPLLNRGMDQLSGGERQTVLIAAAFAQSPDFILLDEPLANLDPKNQVEILNLLTQLYVERLSSQEPVTIIMVTHDVNRGLFQLPESRLLALKDGSLFYDGQTAKFLTATHLEALYDTAFHMVDTSIQYYPLSVPYCSPVSKRKMGYDHG